MSRRAVVLLVVLGIAVGSCALGVGLWLSLGTKAPQTLTLDFSRVNAPKHAVLPAARITALKQISRGTFFLPARGESDHAYIALAAAGGGLLVLTALAAGFVHFRRRPPYFDFS